MKFLRPGNFRKERKRVILDKIFVCNAYNVDWVLKLSRENRTVHPMADFFKKIGQKIETTLGSPEKEVDYFKFIVNI